MDSVEDERGKDVGISYRKTAAYNAEMGEGTLSAILGNWEVSFSAKARTETEGDFGGGEEDGP